MTQILQLSGTLTIINMLKGKVNNMHDRWELSGESEKVLKVSNANDIHKNQYQR